MRLGRPSVLGAEGRHPADGVAREEQQVHARVAHRFDASILADVPVFVVADADERLALQAAVGREHVAVRAIGHVVAVLLEPVGERELERQELAGADRERVVDDAGELRLAAVGAVEADVGPGALAPLGMGVDRVVVGPAVVGLPGVVRALKEDVGRAVVADDEDDVALPVRLGVLVDERREPAEVDAAGPVVRESSAACDGSQRHSWRFFGPGAGVGCALPCERPERRHEPGALGRRNSPCGRSRSGTAAAGRWRP